MDKHNSELILKMISDESIVLDIGGWIQTFSRADYVIDIMPYQTRGVFGKVEVGKERFSKNNWIIHDLNSKLKLPFEDKKFDFVVCSHTLEDIRDPLFLCSEIIRVGKAGYIEVPSREEESIFGLEGKNYTGYCHHRWLIEIKGPEIIFRFKTHSLNHSWKYHLPNSYRKKMQTNERISYLFWKDSFQYKEVVIISKEKIFKELEQFVRERKAYPAFFYLPSTIIANFKIFVKKLLKLDKSKDDALCNAPEFYSG